MAAAIDGYAKSKQDLISSQNLKTQVRALEVQLAKVFRSCDGLVQW